MLISRALIKKCHATISQQEELSSLNLPRLFQQTKQKSQMIAYIWFWGSDRLEVDNPNYENFLNAKKLAECYQYPEENSKNPERTLKNLLSAIPKSDGSELEKLLYAVFPLHPHDNDKYPHGYIFPILNSNEQEFYQFTIDTNSFQGIIKDATVNNRKLEFVVSYPPCPKFSDITVTKNELDDWIKNYGTGSENMIPSNIYIPLCST